MYEYVGFKPTMTETAPQVYLIAPTEELAIARMRDHGIVSRTLPVDSVVAGQRFRVDSVRVARAEYQGHLAQEVFGEWVPAEIQTLAGTVLVDLDQPLGRLAFALLEPRFDDGLASWSIIDLSDRDDEWYPISRIMDGKQ
jgi:hypothetical protein